MQPISYVVVEAIMGEALVDWQTDVVKSSHVHDGLAVIIVNGVVAHVANHLKKLDHRFVGNIIPGEIISEQSRLLVRTSLSSGDLQS